jgi:hypothetical protein
MGVKMTRLIKMPAILMVVACFSSVRVAIELKHGTEAEQRTKAQLEQLERTYDLRKWTFTDKVIIDEESVPHSHPVLTLHTRHLNSDDQLLSTYVHEQLHWWLDQKLEQVDRAKAELRRIYPKVPVGFPDGAQDEQSTYLHLIDCYLEMQADRELLGNDRAAKVIKFWAADHYRWVYRTIIQDEQQIAKVVNANGLEVK